VNDVKNRIAVREAVKKKFNGRQKLNCKIQVRYKENLEREYQRVINAYYDLLLKVLLNTTRLLFIGQGPLQEAQSGFRVDGFKENLINLIRRMFRKAGDDFHKEEQSFHLSQKIDKIGSLAKRLSTEDWKREVSKTLGINILDDYFSGEFYRERLKLWTDENASLISTLPEEVLGEMQDIVEDGFLNGRSNRDIVKEIQERFNVSRNKARFYAVDQLAKLNASITQQQQTDCGVEEYIWSSSKDQRVRERHAQLDGTKHRWDTPPIVDEKTGRRAHPGEDYRCRCVALPVFNLETLDIPAEIKIK
jgi:SPP1 gp7 family putative phage head morphogenesis protein